VRELTSLRSQALHLGALALFGTLARGRRRVKHRGCQHQRTFVLKIVIGARKRNLEVDSA
jgi:hypothetical protein